MSCEKASTELSVQSSLKNESAVCSTQCGLRLTTKRWIVWEKVGPTNKERDEW